VEQPGCGSDRHVGTRLLAGERLFRAFRYIGETDLDDLEQFCRPKPFLRPQPTSNPVAMPTTSGGSVGEPRSLS
jgi:hypothetical protein